MDTVHTCKPAAAVACGLCLRLMAVMLQLTSRTMSGVPWFRQRGRFGGRLPCRASADSAVCRSWRWPVSVTPHNRHEIGRAKLYKKKSSSSKDGKNKHWCTMARFILKQSLFILRLHSAVISGLRRWVCANPTKIGGFHLKKTLPSIYSQIYPRVQLLQQGH